jgi:hypothetical protein
MTPTSRAGINRANAQKSTGPRTESGKQRASQNSLSHGLTARNPLLPSEDRDEYLAFTLQFFDALSPQGPVETQLCQTLADCSWKSNRGMSCEQHLLACAVPAAAAESSAALDASVRTLANIGLYQSRTFRTFEKSMNELHQIQAERRLAERAALLEAARQQQAEEAMAEAEAKFGFVFATPESAPQTAAGAAATPTAPVASQDSGFVFSAPANSASFASSRG